MRIALLAPIYEACPPPGYGGIELVVALLADQFSKWGHAVTLFATGDSATRARLCWTEESGLRTRQIPPSEALVAELIHISKAYSSADDFDIIHNHSGYQAIAHSLLCQTPTVSTLHGPFTPDNWRFFEAMADHPFVAISRAQRDSGPSELQFAGTVHNGIDTAYYDQPIGPGQLVSATEWKRRLLFLGRVSPEKGTHLAIEIARRCGLGLIIAGKVDPCDQAYWKEAVLPHVDGNTVRYVGEVGGARKREILAGALALLHPVQWPEPFGLVMAEAMASGTPIVALSHGSIPEVVDHGVTGFVCQSADEMTKAVALVDSLDSATIRAVCRQRFDVSRMAAQYLAIYQSLASRPRRVMPVSVAWV